MQVGKKNKVKKAIAKNVEDESVSSGTEMATIHPEAHEQDMFMIKSYNSRGGVMRSDQNQHQE